MNVTIFNVATGKVESLVSGREEDINAMLDGGQDCIEGHFYPKDFYINAGEPVAKQAQPTPNHIFNYVTKQWEDPRTLQELKDTQWASIKRFRSAAEYAGFTWDGSTFDSDAVSQNRITGAVTLAQLSSAFTIDWTLATNQVRTLNQSEMLQVGAALGVHVQTQFAKGQSLRVQIDAATTQAEVEAIVW